MLLKQAVSTTTTENLLLSVQLLATNQNYMNNEWGSHLIIKVKKQKHI